MKPPRERPLTVGYGSAPVLRVSRLAGGFRPSLPAGPVHGCVREAV
ncbi:hypothetical protein ACFOYY_37645 [Streptosporangium jomthongense]|uniref:Uncharacterized protein n=1 Tax=Streptosporangium jomthongense TaxID=1193683 RepID=A0ABV8FB53_9ACTN